MNQQEKLLKITNWFKDISEEETKALTEQKNFERIEVIETLVGEKLPTEIHELYQHFDGGSGNGYGAFFGHTIVGLDEMKSSLEFSKTQIKPENPLVKNLTASNFLIEEKIKEVVSELPLKKKLGFLKSKWFKVEFQTGPGSMGGPYFYPNENTNQKEREVIRLSRETRKRISELTKKLHQLELDTYNWDNLEITAFGNGKFESNRTFYDFDNLLPLTSTPPNTIKKKYFHIKWIPLISDCGGNYIGIDLDPDSNGTKEQVIIFGRDEEDMIVLANSWDEFLDWNLDLIEKEGDKLKSESHLHDIYKQIKSA